MVELALICPETTEPVDRLRVCHARPYELVEAFRCHLRSAHGWSDKAIATHLEAVYAIKMLPDVGTITVHGVKSAPACKRCHQPHPKRHTPGRYPALCPDCRAA